MIHRQDNPSPEIEYSVVSIPNEDDYGAGTYSVFFKPNVLLPPKVISSGVMKQPIFQLTLTVNCANSEILLLIGRFDGSPPLSSSLFLLPQNRDVSLRHELSVTFDRWQAVEVKMDGQKLIDKDSYGGITGLSEKQFQGSPILFFEANRRLLEDLFGVEWFIAGNRKALAHPAYESWELSKKMIEQNGSLRFPDDTKNLPKLSRIILDVLTLVLCSGGNVQLIKLGLFDNYGNEKIRKKIFSTIRKADGFKSILAELSYAGWHRSKGNVVIPYEEDSYPDFRIDSAYFELPLVAECKYVFPNTNASRFIKIINKANNQIKQLAIPCYGLVVIDVSERIPLSTKLSDDLPTVVLEISETVQGAIQSDNSSVSAVLLLWDDFQIFGDLEPGNKPLVALRRQYHLVRHKNPKFPLPENRDLDEAGLTYGYTTTSRISFASQQ